MFPTSRQGTTSTFYMIEFAGINPETGAPQFYTNDVDENGNYIKEITENTAARKVSRLTKAVNGIA